MTATTTKIDIGTTQVWVLDQDAAVAFYTETLGWDIVSDVTLPGEDAFRWVTVSPGEGNVDVVLMAIPGEPIFDPADRANLEALVAKGRACTLFLRTPDVFAAYEELKARGVEFNEEPTKQAWGVDCSFRDPSGNNLRLGQLD